MGIFISQGIVITSHKLSISQAKNPLIQIELSIKVVVINITSGWQQPNCIYPLT